jgi:hypothetical protein
MKRAQRRIPQQADDSMSLIRGYTLDDAMLVGPGIAICIFTLALAPPIIRLQGVLLGVLAFLAGVVGLATTPDHYKSTEWVKLHAAHLARQSTYEHLTFHHDHAQRTQTDQPEQTTTQAIFATNQRTQDVLDVERVQPGTQRGDTGYVELTDGTLVGAVQIDPANLSLSTADDWSRTVTQLGSTINTLDFPTQIYRTSRDFDTDAFLQPYYERRGDDDVRNEPVLKTLLTEFLTWYPEELASRGTRITEFYVIVPVHPEEVESSRRTAGFKQQLAAWPLLGRLITTNDEEDAPEAVLRGRQRETLADRLAMVRGHFREITDIDATRVDAVEHAELIAHAYQREDVDQQDQLQTNGITTRDQPAARSEHS